MNLAAAVLVTHLVGGETRPIEALTVWRFNGQQVFSWEAAVDVQISHLTWKANGRVLALATSDNLVRLLNVVDNGRVVHCLSGSDAQATYHNICHLAWAVSCGNSDSLSQLAQQIGAKDDMAQLLPSHSEQGSEQGVVANLPEELACGIDIETCIPKLSALPSGTGIARRGEGAGGDDDIFSTSVSIDAVFHDRAGSQTYSIQQGGVDIVLTSFTDSSVSLRIFECFEIGSISLAVSLPNDGQKYQAVQHAAHSSSSKHVLIFQSSTVEKGQRLHFVALHLNFLDQVNPYYLSTLAAKITSLINLLRYLSQLSVHLSLELRGVFEVPHKFINNLRTTLSNIADGPNDVLLAMYQLVVTGVCIDEVRDWLVDEIGERNLKRWEKATLHGMETIRRLVFESLLPVVERCQIIISRLEGLAEFSKSSQPLGLCLQDLRRVMGLVECINLLGHHLLLAVNREMDSFLAFIKWLKLEVEIQGLERENLGSPRSERLEETSAKRDEINMRDVLEYVRILTGNSEMNAFLRPSLDAQGSLLGGKPYEWPESQPVANFYETFGNILRTKNPDSPRPRLNNLVSKVHSETSFVFKSIAETLRKSILQHPVGSVSGYSISTLAARLVSRNNTSGFDVLVAGKAGDSDDALMIRRLPFMTEKDSKPLGMRRREFRGRMITSVKFAGDQKLMVLHHNDESASLDMVDVSVADDQSRSLLVFDLHNGAAYPTAFDIKVDFSQGKLCLLQGNRKIVFFEIGKKQAQLPECTQMEATMVG